jgi:hypothetical protein
LRFTDPKSHQEIVALTAVVMKSCIFWDMTPCSPLKIDVSEEHIAYIFRAEEQTEQETSSACYLCQVGFLLGLLFDPDDDGEIFLRNVGRLTTDYMALYPRRQKSSYSEVCNGRTSFFEEMWVSHSLTHIAQPFTSDLVA